jgi:splicing factor 3A subunit 3
VARLISGQKHYSKKTVYDAHLTSSKHIKKEKEGKFVPDPNTTNGGTPTPSASSSSREKHRAPARLTYLVSKLLTFPPIPQLLQDSRSEVERRMALTAREREAELEQAEEAAPPPAEINTAEEEEEEDDGTIYNPLKLPLG